MAISNEMFRFKILIIGDSSVGKSSLMTRFVDETFQTSFMPTIGVDFKVRTLMIDNHQCKVQIWDTAGQERFRVITTTYYRDASGILIVYDVTNSETFSNVRRWISEINKYCDDTIPKVLIGNKDDITPADNKPIEKQISTQAAEQYACEMNLPFFETSAKDNKNVNEAFYAITRLALQKQLETRDRTQLAQHNDLANGITSSPTIQLKGSKKRGKKYNVACCK